jgi:hypothetical protein
MNRSEKAIISLDVSLVPPFLDALLSRLRTSTPGACRAFGSDLLPDARVKDSEVVAWPYSPGNNG